ncbi:dihydroorotase family protein [Desulfurococcaceae archaeon MEX13E-LK6-19]|nr:dihydroorotase family protein [Desulfurococcaceae archaeon MEX13E-LK6-19]
MVLSSLLIKNARVFINGEPVEASIYVENGVVKSITKNHEPLLSRAETIIDAENKPVIPGGIDIHAHIYDPDYTHHEDWRTGSLAAGYGGITTVFDMPLRMFVDNIEKLYLKVKKGLEDSYVNFGIHAGMMKDENLTAIPELAEHGVIGFKVFTLKPWGASDHAILKIMDLVRSVDGVVMVHAEDDALIDRGLEEMKNRTDPLAHHEARSDVAEAAAISKIGFYAMVTRAHTHIVHVTSKLGAERIAYFKKKGVKLTAETCPQYLFFTRKDVEKWGNYLKCAPSIKTGADVEGLWDAIASGVIDAIASDHAPAPRNEKEVDVWSAWGGLPVIELIIPFTYTFGVKKGRISFSRFVEVVSTNPAKIMKLYPRKGAILPGSDADLVVLDVDYCEKVDPAKLHHKVDWCPWEGVELCGWPRHVIVNGELLIQDRELVGKPGMGRYVGEYFKKTKE